MNGTRVEDIVLRPDAAIRKTAVASRVTRSIATRGRCSPPGNCCLLPPPGSGGPFALAAPGAVSSPGATIAG